MNKEEIDINQELEQMRRDYADLKERFDKQQIINEQLMQKAMKKDVRRLFLSKKMVPAGMAVLIVTLILCFVKGCEWWLPVSLIVLSLIYFPGVYWAYKGVDEDEIFNGDILSTTEALLKFKKRYIVVEAGICIYFFAFFVAATFHMTSLNISAEQMWRRGIIAALLCVGTLILEYVYAKRLLKSCDDIVGRLRMREDNPQKN